MKKIYYLVVCGVFAMLFASCSTKQSAINQLESFSTELRDHSRYYDIQDWERAGKKFVDITKTVKKYELKYTPEELARIGKLEGECAGYMARGAKDNVTDRLKGFLNELKGILQGVTDAFGGW
jgi:nicotinamide mononucleotide (NMN) deamidase PncC